MYAETAAEVHLRWRANATAMANWNSEGNCLAEWFATSQEQEDQLQVYETASYSYAVASISFTRSPKMWLLTYLIPAVVLVIVSYLGFFIDPAATPARVALGMLCLVVVMTNFVVSFIHVHVHHAYSMYMCKYCWHRHVCNRYCARAHMHHIHHAHTTYTHGTIFGINRLAGSTDVQLRIYVY